MLAKIKEYYEGKTPFTMILNDPIANSFIQSYGEDDSRLKTIYYERTFEQNEVLGLNDIDTEHYDDRIIL